MDLDERNEVSLKQESMSEHKSMQIQIKIQL